MSNPTDSLANRLSVIGLPAFSDNYLWLLTNGNRAAVVDPGDAQPVLDALSARGLTLEAILVTHHHPDHIGGIPALLSHYAVPVYGPALEIGRIPMITQPLGDGDHVDVLGLRAEVIGVPGHTLGHIAYHFAGAGALFCGDTLFHAGCGRLFEGTPEQMLASLTRLAALPDETAVYCAHEYTLSNLAFALAVEPDNDDIRAAVAECRALREQGLPTVPSRIDRERRINPFMRARVPGIAARAPEPPVSADPVNTFASLRRWKDHFRPA